MRNFLLLISKHSHSRLQRFYMQGHANEIYTWFHVLKTTRQKKFLTLWGQAGLWPSHCKSPCRRPPQWSFLLHRPPAQSCWTGNCRAEGSDQAALLSPSWCTTSQSLETHNYCIELQILRKNKPSNVKIPIVVCFFKVYWETCRAHFVGFSKDRVIM